MRPTPLWINKSVLSLLGILLMALLTTHSLAAPLASRDNKALTPAMLDDMFFAGESIAGSHFSDQEKQALKTWAIDLYLKNNSFQGVLSAFDKYARYRKLAQRQQDPRLRNLIWHHLYRDMQFRWRFPRFQNQQLTLLDVIQRYNPVQKRRAQEKMLLAANDRLVVESGDYFLSENMLTALEVVTQFLARANLSDSERQNLRTWAIADFKNTPDHSTIAYADFLDRLVPQALNPKQPYEQESVRSSTFQNYYFSFRDDPFARQWSGDLIDIAVAHNPLLIVDDKNRLLITRSQLDDMLATARYFSEQLQLGLRLTPQFRQAEQQHLLSRFMQRQNLASHVIDSAWFLRSQHYWANLPDADQQQLATLIRSRWQQNRNIWEALQPLFTRLDQQVQRENQQQLLEQQLLGRLLLQQLQINQMIHNNVLKSYKEAGDNISRSIRDQSITQSVHISGGRIIETHKDHFVVENQRGVRYNIPRQ